MPARAAALIVLAGVAAPATPAAADTTIHVAPGVAGGGNDGRCSLAEAIQFAGGDPAPDCAPGVRSGTTTIVVPAGCYDISARLALGHTTVIEGAGPGPASCGGGTVIRQTENDWVM